MAKWNWQPIKPVDPSASTCACGSPATIDGECGACFGTSESQLDSAAVIRPHGSTDQSTWTWRQ